MPAEVKVETVVDASYKTSNGVGVEPTLARVKVCVVPESTCTATVPLPVYTPDTATCADFTGLDTPVRLSPMYKENAELVAELTAPSPLVINVSVVFFWLAAKTPAASAKINPTKTIAVP